MAQKILSKRDRDKLIVIDVNPTIINNGSNITLPIAISDVTDLATRLENRETVTLHNYDIELLQGQIDSLAAGSGNLPTSTDGQILRSDNGTWEADTHITIDKYNTNNDSDLEEINIVNKRTRFKSDGFDSLLPIETEDFAILNTNGLYLTNNAVDNSDYDNYYSEHIQSATYDNYGILITSETNKVQKTFSANPYGMTISSLASDGKPIITSADGSFGLGEFPNAAAANEYISINITAPENLTSNRFVNYDYKQSTITSDAKILGISKNTVASANNAEIIISGIGNIELAADVSIGAALATDSAGKAKNIVVNSKINARALENGVIGQIIKCVVVP